VLKRELPFGHVRLVRSRQGKPRLILLLAFDTPRTVV
jgi:hypothetical protein